MQWAPRKGAPFFCVIDKQRSLRLGRYAQNLFKVAMLKINQKSFLKIFNNIYMKLIERTGWSSCRKGFC